MSTLNITESGYYFCLFHGPKMIKSIANGNCYWEIKYIEVVETEKIIGSRKLKSGIWVSSFGSVNWMRYEACSIIRVQKVDFPPLPKE
jgi:hypothetical protein